MAAVNRPKDEKDYDIVNIGLTKLICDTVRSLRKKISIILASSTQAKLSNNYGLSKLNAE